MEERRSGGAELCSCCPAEFFRLWHHPSEENNHSFIPYKKINSYHWSMMLISCGAVTETWLCNFTIFKGFKGNSNRREIKPPIIALMQKQLFVIFESSSFNTNCICSLFSLKQAVNQALAVSSPEQAESAGSFSAFELKQGQRLWFQQRPAVHFTDIPKVSMLFRESQPGLWWRTHQDAPSRMSQTGSQLHKFTSLKSYLCLSFELQRNSK